MPFKKIAIDVGYSAVKIVDAERNKFIFPTIYEQVSRDPLAPVVRQIQMDGAKPLSVGEGAIKDSFSVDTEFHGSDRWRVFIAAALFEVFKFHNVQPGEVHVDQIAVGLPLEQFYSKEARERCHLASIEFKGNGDDYQVSIGETRVLPQGFAVFQVVHSLEKQNVGILDIGHLTLDYSVFLHGEISRSECSSKRMGVSEMYRSIRQEYSRKTTGAPISDLRISELIRSPKTKYRGEEFDFTESIIEAFATYWERVVEEVMHGWQNSFDYLDRIVVTGGGANILGIYGASDNIKGIPLELIKTPEFANAAGYMNDLG